MRSRATNARLVYELSALRASICCASASPRPGMALHLLPFESPHIFFAIKHVNREHIHVGCYSTPGRRTPGVAKSRRLRLGLKTTQFMIHDHSSPQTSLAKIAETVLNFKRLRAHKVRAVASCGQLGKIRLPSRVGGSVWSLYLSDTDEVQQEFRAQLCGWICQAVFQIFETAWIAAHL
jgi:hypothetical protein